MYAMDKTVRTAAVALHCPRAPPADGLSPKHPERPLGLRGSDNQHWLRPGVWVKGLDVVLCLHKFLLIYYIYYINKLALYYSIYEPPSLLHFELPPGGPIETRYRRRP